MFLPDVEGALTGMRKLLNQNARLAAAVWAASEKVPMLSMPMGVVGRMLELPPPPAGAPGMFSLADATALEQRFANAGFTEVRSEPMPVTFRAASVDDYIQLLKDCSPPLNTLLADRPSGLQQEAWEAIRAAAGKFADSDGGMSMPNECIVVVGRRAD